MKFIGVKGSSGSRNTCKDWRERRNRSPPAILDRLVGDFHRTLLSGGIFYYPADLKDPTKNEGKLRLLYEAAPLAFIAEQAGGYASNGRQNILDIQPRSLHQRTPLFVGNRALVEKAEEYIKRYG